MIISKYKSQNFFVILFLIPIFSGVPELLDLVNDWYILTLPIVLLWAYLTNLRISDALKDNAFIFIVLLALFSLSVDINADLVTNLESLKKTDTWLLILSTLICFQLAVMRVNYSSFIAAAMIGVLIFYLNKIHLYSNGEISYSDFFNQTGYSFVAATASLLLFMSGKRFLSLLLLFFVVFQLTRGVIVAYIGAVLLYYYVVYFNNIRVRNLMPSPKYLVFFIIMTLLFFEILAGLIFSSELNSISTGRSLFYNIILNTWLSTGLDTFFPVSSVFSSEVISEYTLYAADEKGRLLYAVKQCPHSLLIELAVDYGIYVSFIIIAGLVMFASKLSIIAVLYFLLFASFQCENFALMYFVPFYISYRIFLNEEWRFLPNAKYNKKV